MIQSEVTDIQTKNKYKVSFFEDDTIDVVRQQIAKSIDVHPDRLFILVALQLPKDYYKKDPRRWEALFGRLSYNGKPLDKDIFQEYQLNYRFPNSTLPFSAYDKSEWMNVEGDLDEFYETAGTFTEYRIFGVEEDKSYILPMNINNQTVTKIQSSRLPIPEQTSLFSTLYDTGSVKGFLIKQYDDSVENLANIYYPFFRSTTPTQMTEESIRILNKNSNTLQTLLDIKVPEPTKISILRSRFHIPFVGTDFGEAVRTRFEQIFYGLTVSEDTPYIGLFSSKNEITRHKFYTNNPRTKETHLDINKWNAWWNITKPSRNRPTLVFYRGKTKQDFDRIAITSIDIVLSSYRSENNTETVSEIEKELKKWLESLDAVIPFLDKEDIHPDRWDLQDMSFLARYSDKLDEFDLRRFNCLNAIFDDSDPSKTTFGLLRTDRTNDGISAIDLKILQLMRDNPMLRSSDISQELQIPKDQAAKLLNELESRIAEDPKLPDRAFRGFPILRFGPDSVIVSSINKLETTLAYANILRYILSNPTSNELDQICPKRVETVKTETTSVSTKILDVDAAIAEEYNDLFDYLEQEEAPKTEEKVVQEEIEPQQTFAVGQKISTLYNYFISRLQQFDPITFDTTGSLYPKKCEQKHQPIIVSEKEKTRLKDTPYDITKNFEDNEKIEIENPDGTVICPEYWCMRDQIPLSEEQLIRDTGTLQCPVCKGKIRTKADDDPRKFPLLKRESGFTFPGFIDYKSPKNGRPLPCCFKRSKTKKMEKIETDAEDKYYILNSTKVDISQFRVAFLTQDLLKSLSIPETYEIVISGGRRIQSGMSGFFRVGMGRISESLPTFLNLKVKIPEPKDSLETILKCSFLSSWRIADDKYVSEIESDLKQIPAYEADDISRSSIAKLISGIQVAYEKQTLTPMQELEYSSIFLQCDVFRININTNTLGCVFFTQMNRSRSRGIVVTQLDNEISILSHVSRVSRAFKYRTNIFESPFKKETYQTLEKLRTAVCKTNIPTYDDALGILKEIMIQTDTSDFSIILDPYSRGQAFFAPNKFILPFQSSPVPEVSQSKIAGYSDIPSEQLPLREQIIQILEIASKYNSSYAFKEDSYNSQNQKVELLTESGLRIPFQAIDKRPSLPTEILQTVSKNGESELTFGDHSDLLKQTHSKVSYSSEMYEFLLFQLTKDIREDNEDLKAGLLEVKPSKEVIEPLLKKWYDGITSFVKTNDSADFVSKIRSPCGQFKKDECTGNVCGWDGKVCRIQIKKSVSSDALFHRLLFTLIENSKIRGMILDGRTTPFFSTILYIELPHEVILTDNTLPI